ncbi:MAG: sugar transferase [Anaerolineae bacterium]
MIEVKINPASWSRLSVETVHRTRLAGPETSLYPVAKRCMDIILAAVLLVLLAPLMALIALAIWLDSPGPVVFRQERVGQFGRPFTMFKFRSMYANADEQVHRQFAKQYINGHVNHLPECGQVVFKPNGDKRVTRVGKWLRRTSLDELPQLINVLRGEMSLVGPRPAVRYEVEEYTPWHMQRLTVPPGITGLAQISGRSGLTFDKIVHLDIEYIQRRSLGLDILILLKTIPVVLKAKCAA